MFYASYYQKLEREEEWKPSETVREHAFPLLVSVFYGGYVWGSTAG